MYQHIVSFVNQSFGVATNNEIRLLDDRNVINPPLNINVSTFFNQVDTPIHDLSSTDPRLASLSQLLHKEDETSSVIYTHINNLIKSTVQHL